MEPAFLSAIINSYIGRQQIGPITQGVAQKKVSLGRFSFIALPLPPVDEQRKILEWLAAAEGEIGAQEVAVLLALKKSAAQRQNILKAAFSGQLVPQDPNDEPAAVLLERIRAERAAAGTGSGKRGRKTRALS
jgi:type I restriction enzyme S subunit